MNFPARRFAIGRKAALFFLALAGLRAMGSSAASSRLGWLHELSRLARRSILFRIELLLKRASTRGVGEC
jgi:hypothetical protein